tara:strand:+ start:18732 stop:19562 length:831 start_codon:yes stop_codon:yes gene_type:complete
VNICISFLILLKIIILKSLEYFQFSFTDVIDIVLVAILLFYLYRLVKGTVAINILIGIIIIYIIWKITDLLKMDVLSNILGNFISVGFFALIVVFQQEIRKFLLLIGSPNFAARRNLIKYFNFLNQNSYNKKFDIKLFLDDCYSMSKKKTGAIIVIERGNSLEFLITSGNNVNIKLSSQILETIFFKNNPLHDGAVLIRSNYIVATRVVLPVSESTSIPSRFGLRHRAAIGITEKTDAIAIVISEQTGEISYVKDGVIANYKNQNELNKLLLEDLL